jgi:fructose-specific phosphotransferase system IIA component
MKISEYLREARIILELKGKSKEEVIKEIGERLKGEEEVKDYGLFLKEVFEREGLSSTGIGNQIAIPHARTDAVNDFVIGFGRSREGVEFEALDGKPVKFIFLMGTPKEKGINSYLKILAHLTRVLNKSSFQEALLRANSAAEVIEEFRKLEH